MSDTRAKLLEAIAEAANTYFDSNLNYGFNRLRTATLALREHDANPPAAKGDAS